MDKQIRAEIKEAKSLMDVVNVMNKHYDLEAPLSLTGKGVVSMGIEKVVLMTGAKRRK